MMNRRAALRTMTAGLAAGVTACGRSGDDVSLQGSGATFPAPLYQRWFLEYYRLAPDVRVNYQAIGSGAGLRQFTEGLTVFGASDSAMSDKEIAAASEARGAGVVMLPMTAGSVAVAYNVPGVPAGTELRMSRAALREILLGRVTDWNDPAIASINPGVSLPDLPITFVRRSDGSGTTYAFTNHLSSAGAEFKSAVGVGKSVTWPVGIGGKGNNGVAALVDQTPGAMGYIEAGFADLVKLPTMALENKAGKYVRPTVASGQAALAGAKLPSNFRLFLPDPAAEGAYPVVTYTWLLALGTYGDGRKAEALKAVLEWCLTKGQHLSESLGYIPLPRAVTEPVRAAAAAIQG